MPAAARVVVPYTPTNQYAKIVHANMLDRKAFAFAVDDVGNFESLVTDAASARPRSRSARSARPTTSCSAVDKNSGKCVDARSSGTANGIAIQQYTCDNTDAQQFLFQPTSGGCVRINNRNSSVQMLDVKGVSKADGALVQLRAYGRGTNEQWLPVAEGSGLEQRQMSGCPGVIDRQQCPAAAVHRQRHRRPSFRLVAQP